MAINGRVVFLTVFFVLVTAMISVAPSVVFGQQVFNQPIVPCDGTAMGGQGNKECTICDLATMAQNLINAMIFIAVFLSAILFAWAGVKFLSNQMNGGEKALGDAKKIFFNVMVGLVIILAAWLLVDTIFLILVGDHLWSKVC